MKLMLAVWTLFFATAISAQELQPEAQIKRIADEVIALAKQVQGGGAGSPEKIRELIDTRVVPNFNFDRMAALALGRNWRKASAPQQQALSDEFRVLLVRTYSSALAHYRNEAIEFKPVRAAPGDTDITVRSVVRRPGVGSIDIDYSMEKTPAGWKIYDVVVGGVSLVTNYRESFNQLIRERGVDGLISTLANKNRSQAIHAGTSAG